MRFCGFVRMRSNYFPLLPPPFFMSQSCKSNDGHVVHHVFMKTHRRDPLQSPPLVLFFHGIPSPSGSSPSPCATFTPPCCVALPAGGHCSKKKLLFSWKSLRVMTGTKTCMRHARARSLNAQSKERKATPFFSEEKRDAVKKKETRTWRPRDSVFLGMNALRESDTVSLTLRWFFRGESGPARIAFFREARSRFRLQDFIETETQGWHVLEPPVSASAFVPSLPPSPIPLILDPVPDPLLLPSPCLCQ